MRAALPTNHPLQLYATLRYALCGTAGLAQIDPSIFDGSTALLKPERDALKAELFHARGLSNDYTSLKNATMHATPGLAWWFKRIDAGGGFLRSLRFAPWSPPED
jgi:hypothetical protein